jgi:putative nucleotidyltransferase with HDIG domain
LARAGALYHDIGKIRNPNFFIENIIDTVNPHKQLTPEQSAAIIISHVTEGIAIAKKHRIPQDIIDFIQTHHGTSYVGYFLNEYRRQTPNAGDESHFRYPGPKPMTKEQGILMMADAVEASSRSMGQQSEKAINELVENIINYQINQQQHNNIPLSLKEITIVKNVFKQKLVNIYHDRNVE